jgi:quercetin dioxygenase-like cupin family protein
MPIIHIPTEPTHELQTTRFWRLAAPSTGSREASVWRIELTPGAPPVPHQVTREEILVVLSGKARVSIDGNVDYVPAWGAIVVPANTPFSLTAAGEVPVVALAYLPVGGQAMLADGEPFTPPWAL